MSTISARELSDTADLVQNTVWGIRLSALSSLGQPVTPMKGTTLNEKFTINERASFKQTDQLKTAWYCIGNKGSRQSTSSHGVDISMPIPHEPVDAALYGHLPFVLRRVGDDLNDLERENYRLRRIEEHGGVQYIAYYAKKFDVDQTVRVIAESVVNGVTKPDDYEPTEINLSPKPPTIAPNRVERTSNTKIHVSSGARIVFDSNDVEELRNVCRILYDGDIYHAVISEIGIIMGVDERYTSPTDGLQYTEIKGATISTFIATRREMIYNSDGFTEELWIGEKTPLLLNSALVPTVGS